ncbi:MAG: hypothetical protein R2712_07710 [Vicinamibacterales bacterium]
MRTVRPSPPIADAHNPARLGLVAATRHGRVTTYLNNAIPASEKDMLAVFPEQTLTRLNALKKKHDPENLFKIGAWQYDANL